MDQNENSSKQPISGVFDDERMKESENEMGRKRKATDAEPSYQLILAKKVRRDDQTKEESRINSLLKGRYETRMLSDTEEEIQIMIKLFQKCNSVNEVKFPNHIQDTTVIPKFSSIVVNDKSDFVEFRFEIEITKKTKSGRQPADAVEKRILTQFYNRKALCSLRTVQDQSNNQTSDNSADVIITEDAKYKNQTAIITAKTNWTYLKKQLRIESVEELKRTKFQIQPEKQFLLLKHLIKALQCGILTNEPVNFLMKGLMGIEPPSIQPMEFSNVAEFHQELTADQTAIIQSFLTKKSRMIVAETGAGTGKTRITQTIIRTLARKARKSRLAEEQLKQLNYEQNELFTSKNHVQKVEDLAQKELNNFQKMLEAAVVEGPKLLLFTATKNNGVVNGVGGILDLPEPPIIFISLAAIRRVQEHNPEVLEHCLLQSHCRRVLKNHRLQPMERLILEAAAEMEEKKFRKITHGTSTERKQLADEEEELLEKKLRAGLDSVVLDADDENQEQENEKLLQKTDQILLIAFLLVMKHSPPAAIAATVAMAFIRGAFLKNVVNSVILDGAETTPQAEFLALLSRIPRTETLLAVGDLQQLSPYTRNIRHSVVKLGYQSVLQILTAKNSGSNILRLELRNSFRFTTKMLSHVNSWVYDDFDLESEITIEDDEIFAGIIPDAFDCVHWVNVHGQEQQVLITSFQNPEQTEEAIRIVTKVRESRKHHGLSIAVLSLYYGQYLHLRDSFPEELNVHLSTVDNYHGAEADIVLLLLTRHSFHRENEFINNVLRRNVALTRARRGMLIIGDPYAFSKTSSWQPVVSKLKNYYFSEDNW